MSYTSWKYKKSVTLTHASGVLTSYQKKILVGESSGATGEDVDCGALCKTDFSDLRFSNTAGTSLSYWIESITGTTPNQLAIVWVNFDSIGTSATTFYMYYGNANATTEVNGTNTFPFWEDFATLDLSVWTPLTTDGTVTVANSIMSLNNTTGGGSLNIVANVSHWTLPIVVEWKYRRPSFYRNRVHIGEIATFDWGDFSPNFYWNGFTGVSFTNNVWYIYQVTHLSNNLALNIYDTAYASVLLARTSAVTWANNGMFSAAGTENTSSDIDIDWVRSRQYAAVEPTWGSWSVQTSNVISPFACALASA